MAEPMKERLFAPFQAGGERMMLACRSTRTEGRRGHRQAGVGHGSSCGCGYRSKIESDEPSRAA